MDARLRQRGIHGRARGIARHPEASVAVALARAAVTARTILHVAGRCVPASAMREAYSGVMPAALTTAAHLTMSAATTSRNAAGLASLTMVRPSRSNSALT